MAYCGSELGNLWVHAGCVVGPCALRQLSDAAPVDLEWDTQRIQCESSLRLRHVSEGAGFLKIRLQNEHIQVRPHFLGNHQVSPKETFFTF